MKYIFLVVSFAALLLACDVQVELNANDESYDRKTLGTHEVTIKPPGASRSSSSLKMGDEETYRFTSGDTAVAIKNENLYVNSLSYGELTSGVEVLVDHGAVFIGGEEVQGAPVTESDALDTASAGSSTKQLAGYPVTVAPGAMFTTTSEIFGKHTLMVGNTKVIIHDDRLFVNDVAYGRLTAGDTIMINGDQVLVSGEIRSPAN